MAGDAGADKPDAVPIVGREQMINGRTGGETSRRIGV